MLEGDNALYVKRHRASYLWIEIVGEGVNRYTTRRYVSPDGALHVYLSSAVIKHELSFTRTKIIERINEIMGEQVLTDLIIH